MRRSLFFGYALCLAAANLNVLVALVNLSRENATASHHVLIPFVTLGLMYQRRDSIFATVRSDWALGGGVILAGLAILLSERFNLRSDHASLSVMVGALVLMFVGGFLLFYGRDAFRAAMFPLLFLGFMIPVPSVVLDSATQFLKTASAEAVAGLFTLTGTPYHRQGFVFSLPTVAIEIADECSGIRSSIALLLTSLLAGQAFLKSWWRRALLVAVVFPLAILKNGIRIVTLSLLAMHVDPGYITGQLHHEGGIVFFLVTLAILSPLILLLAKSEVEPECI